MTRFIKRTSLFTFCVTLFSLSLLRAQIPVSVQYDPARSNPGPFYDYTVVGFFTSSPPLIDAVIDDICWTKPIAPPTAASAGAGFDGTNFPANQNISMPNNVADAGTVAPNTVPANTYTGAYPASAGSFGISWDLNYLYFAVKIVNQAAADLTTSTNDRGISLYFNNGNGRSGVADPINENYPRKYNNLRDMNVQLWYLPAPGNTEYPILGAIAGLANYGISLPPDNYKFAVRKTSNGYIYEGRISWKTLNKEFINEADGSYVDDSHPGANDSKWRPFKGRMLGWDMEAALLRGNGPQMDMMWNECCFNVNWTRSAYYGYILLAGDTTGTVCPTAFNTSLTSSIVTTANQKITVSAGSFQPVDAAREINWELTGTSGSNPLAVIDNNTGIITPLNNGNLTITGRPKLAKCNAGNVFSKAVLSIASQVSPTSIIVTAPDITTPWGTSSLIASTNPANAPADVVWSIDPASNLATINSITGLLKATALGNGIVTVKATSLANGLAGTKDVYISGQTVINCFTANAYSNVVQCDRTINRMTIGGFNIGSKVSLVTQYYDPVSMTVLSIPDDLMIYTVQLLPNVPAASIAKSQNWELTLNQQQGTFSVTGTYLNDTTKKVQVKVTLKGTINYPTCTDNVFNIGTECGNIVPDVNVTSALIAGGPSSLTVGNSYIYSTTVLPANATDPSITWSSSNSSVGTINSSGFFTALGQGTTTITATSVSNPTVSGSKLISIITGSCNIPSQPSAFDNVLTSVNAGLQSYNIISVAGVTYVWNVSGSGNFVAFDNGNSAIVNWISPGILTVTPSNGCGTGTVRSLSVTNINSVACTPPSQPGDFDNKSTTVCPGNVTYRVPYVNTVAYVWSVTGTGNSIFTANANVVTINWVNPGTLYVKAVIGSCESSVRLLNVLSTSLPPKPSITVTGIPVFCLGGSALLTSSSFTNNVWSTGETTQSITVTTSGSYMVTVGQNCSNTSDAVSISTLTPPVQNICMVTVDDVVTYNKIIFEKPADRSNIAKWRIYRESTQTDQFDLMGTVYPSELSVFTDGTSFPSARSYKYKIQTEDTCGNKVFGDPHTTMHLSINKGLNNNSWNLIWNAYQGVSVTSYNIYRGTSSANLTFLNAVSGNFTSYTDASAPDVADLYYVIELVSDGCNPTAREESYQSIRSNVARTSVTSIKTDQNYELSIAPNPSSGSFVADNKSDRILKYRIINGLGIVAGEGLLNVGANNLYFNLPKGVYLFLTDTISKKISIE